MYQNLVKSGVTTIISSTEDQLIELNNNEVLEKINYNKEIFIKNIPFEIAFPRISDNNDFRGGLILPTISFKIDYDTNKFVTFSIFAKGSNKLIGKYLEFWSGFKWYKMEPALTSEFQKIRVPYPFYILFEPFENIIYRMLRVRVKDTKQMFNNNFAYNSKVYYKKPKLVDCSKWKPIWGYLYISDQCQNNNCDINCALSVKRETCNNFCPLCIDLSNQPTENQIRLTCTGWNSSTTINTVTEFIPKCCYCIDSTILNTNYPSYFITDVGQAIIDLPIWFYNKVKVKVIDVNNANQLAFKGIISNQDKNTSLPISFGKFPLLTEECKIPNRKYHSKHLMIIPEDSPFFDYDIRYLPQKYNFNDQKMTIETNT